MGFTNRSAFKKQIASVIGDSRCLIFDLSRLKRPDSSDLGLIIACLTRQRGLGGDLRVCSLSKKARVLFELVKMHHVLDIFNTPDEAVTSYVASEPQDCQ
jgi:anti-sigma B factor antagonist